MADFNKKPYNQINQENQFGIREVGITHPDNPAYIKITDAGDIHIMVHDNCGIIISATGGIVLVGDIIKFLTKEDEGLRLNNLAFNTKATTYSEPAFIYPKQQAAGIYDGISDFLS